MTGRKAARFLLRILVAMTLLSGGLLEEGCATKTKRESPSDFAAACTVKRDPVKGETFVLSSTEKFVMPDDTGYLNYYFVGGKPDNGPPEFALVVGSLRTEWAFWNEAVDDAGRHFPLVSTATQSDSGSFAESNSAVIDKNYLDAMAAKGTTWNVKGLRAGAVISLNAMPARGFLDRCQKEFGTSK